MAVGAHAAAPHLGVIEHGTLVAAATVLDINPEPWRAPEFSVGRRAGKLVAIGSPNPKVVTYQNALREALDWPGTCLVWPTEPFDGVHLDVRIFFWRKRHRSAADATNLVKSTEDALHGSLFTNDASNHRVTGRIMEQNPMVRPAVVIMAKLLKWNDDDEWASAMLHEASKRDIQPSRDNDSGIDPTGIF
jgi:hypothetical protein